MSKTKVTFNITGRALKVIGACARKASPRWLEAVTNEFDFRWCVTALKKQKLIPGWVSHFDLGLYDVLFEICTKLSIADKVLSLVGFRGASETAAPEYLVKVNPQKQTPLVHENVCFLSTLVLLQVLPDHRPTPTDRPLLVRQGLHFALTAAAKALKMQPTSADLFSVVPTREVATGGVHESLLAKSPAGSYFAKKLGLRDGVRLRKLDTACDVTWILQDREARDNYPKIAANALLREIFLLAPAAKCFI